MPKPRPNSRNATKSEALRRVVPRGQVPRSGVQTSDEEVSRWFEDKKNDYKMGEKRKVATRSSTSRRCANASRSRRRTCSRPVRRQPAAVLAARTGARQPHPLEDRGERRRRGEETGRGPGPAGQGRRELRGTGRRNTPRTTRTTPREATSGFFGRGRDGSGGFDKVAFSMQPGQVSDVVASSAIT